MEKKNDQKRTQTNSGQLRPKSSYVNAYGSPEKPKKYTKI
jgi:hypothetical protein